MKNRPDYLKVLREFKDKKVIKIVTGIRRCGKSSLLQLFAQSLVESGVPVDKIIQMNFESMAYREIEDDLNLYNYLRHKIQPMGKTYIILDEVQMVSQWERAINSLQVDFDVDIYITGSNAYLLSSELSTLLSGRYVEIKMLPLSFKEFLDFHEFAVGIGLDEKFQNYLQYGGMPAIAEYNFNQPRINEMLEGVYATVILKDILERNKVGDQPLLQKIVRFLADNIGNIVSPNSIGNILAHEGNLDKSKKSPASRTVESYLDMLHKSYIFYSAGRYDIKGKQYLKTLGKHYIVDMGIRNMLLGYRDADRGHILENIVFLELLRRDYKVYIGKIGEKEIDFIAEKPAEKLYVQVTETMLGEETRTRELTPLMEVKDNYEKVILSLDKNYITSYEGIKVKNIIDFLLE